MTALMESLSRTLLLMRDEFRPDIDDRILLQALTTTRIALIADAENIASHAAQTAFVTAAMLMARSGHQVFLMAPNVLMAGPQPPLPPGGMIEQLAAVGRDLLPGIEFIIGEPQAEVDLAIALGNTRLNIPARRHIWLNAEAWAGIIMREHQPSAWNAAMWPFGSLAAAGLGAGEAFKMAIHKLLEHARSPENTAAVFGYTDEVRFDLAPPDTPFCRDLGAIDCVSGGAIINAVLYCLARIPAVSAHGRIIEPDAAELTNLNRYMLLLRSVCESETNKARHLAETFGDALRFQPLPQKYGPALLDTIAPLAPTVVVGVDHIPTRWAVQVAAPKWLAIGATTHWSAMASFHSEGFPCARCLHNRDDPDGGSIIPTTACVSFWAGLLTATYLARRVVGQAMTASEQQIYLTPFRPERAFQSAVAARPDCPTCQRFSGTASPSAAA